MTILYKQHFKENGGGAVVISKHKAGERDIVGLQQKISGPACVDPGDN